MVSRLLLASALVVACPGTGLAQTPPNLSGTWRLNASASDAGSGGADPASNDSASASPGRETTKKSSASATSSRTSPSRV